MKNNYPANAGIRSGIAIHSELSTEAAAVLLKRARMAIAVFSSVREPAPFPVPLPSADVKRNGGSATAVPLTECEILTVTVPSLSGTDMGDKIRARCSGTAEGRSGRCTETQTSDMEEEGKDQHRSFSYRGVSLFQFWYSRDTLMFRIPLNVSQTARFGYNSVV